VTAPERTRLGDLEISRIVTGLWQVADRSLDTTLVDDLARYARAGFDTFDLADHYGPAEELAGALREHATCFTKWCPLPGEEHAAHAAVERARARMRCDAIDLLQLHCWSFRDPRWVRAMTGLAELRRDGRIKNLGVTNFDTRHLRTLLEQGYPIVSNQVCFSLLDRRAAGAMSALCLGHGVRLLAYGTLAGGFLTDRWLDQREPDDLPDPSARKYKRFIDAAGGWSVLQTILSALAQTARKHGVTIANVATRWVLEHEAVAAVIVGARLGAREHRADNLRMFELVLDREDHARLAAAHAITTRLPGDCGDEYRHPPYLTASGRSVAEADG
jgi:aryl-alcohol dehydrogenase-like predicted oxidoreductase